MWPRNDAGMNAPVNHIKPENIDKFVFKWLILYYDYIFIINSYDMEFCYVFPPDFFLLFFSVNIESW